MIVLTKVSIKVALRNRMKRLSVINDNSEIQNEDDEDNIKLKNGDESDIISRFQKLINHYRRNGCGKKTKDI